MSDIETHLQRVMQELLCYWRERPQAADTLEGIRRWWLAGTAVSQPELARVLELLVQRGEVQAVAAADGRVRFRRLGGPEVTDDAKDTK